MTGWAEQQRPRPAGGRLRPGASGSRGEIDLDGSPVDELVADAGERTLDEPGAGGEQQVGWRP